MKRWWVKIIKALEKIITGFAIKKLKISKILIQKLLKNKEK